MKNKRSHFHILFLFLLMSLSFTLMSFRSKNNWRIEKRHYRKGFYVDFWFHPKTYPQAATAQRDISPAEKTKPAPVPANSPTKTSDGGVTTQPAVQQNVTPVSTAPEEQKKMEIPANNNEAQPVNVDDKKNTVENGSVKVTTDKVAAPRSINLNVKPVSLQQKSIHANPPHINANVQAPVPNY